MSKVYEFASFRLARALKQIHKEKDQIISQLNERNEHLNNLEKCLGSYARVLKAFDSVINRHQDTCQQTQAQNYEMMRLLEADDLEKLIDYRKKLKGSNSN